LRRRAATSIVELPRPFFDKAERASSGRAPQIARLCCGNLVAMFDARVLSPLRLLRPYWLLKAIAEKESVCGRDFPCTRNRRRGDVVSPALVGFGRNRT
jgi:hypothetical protein